MIHMGFLAAARWRDTGGMTVMSLLLPHRDTAGAFRSSPSRDHQAPVNLMRRLPHQGSTGSTFLPLESRSSR